MTSNIRAVVTLLATMATGCTRYATHEVHGPRQEISRRLQGAPMVQEEMLASLDAGYAGVQTNDGYGTTYSAGGFSADAGAVRRTHCVQQAEVDYVQQVDVLPHVENRALDVFGSVALAVTGLGTYGVGRMMYSFDRDTYESDLEFYNRDPSFFPRPTEPSPPSTVYAIGGAMVIGAAAWLLYSYAVLPRGEAPVPRRGQRSWTETTHVEATGCGLVPADR